MKPARALIVVVFVVAASTWASAALASEGPMPQATSGSLEDTRFVVSGFGLAAAAHADGLSGGTGFGGAVAGFFSPVLGAEFSVRLQSFDVAGTDANELSSGTLDAIVVTGNVVARFPTSGKVVPYVTGGVAFYTSDFEIESGLASDLAAFNFTAVDSVENAVGFNAGGGVLFALGRSFGVFGEARYVVASADTTGGLSDQVSGVTREVAGSQKLNNLSIGFGVSILF